MKLSKDKQLHAAVGLLIGLLIPPPWGIICWMGAAIGKEAYDKVSKRGVQDIYDVYWTCAGGALGSLVHIVT